MTNLKNNTDPQTQFNVPTYSQFLDVSEQGWQQNACGIVSLKMLLSYWDIDAPSCNQLIQKGLEIDGFIPGIGWKHAATAQLAKSFGLQAENFDWASLSPKQSLTKLFDLLAQYPVIASIYKDLTPGESGHLVVITGVDKHTNTIYYNDPHAKKRSNIKRKAGIEEFIRGWKQRIVVAQPNKVQ